MSDPLLWVTIIVALLGAYLSILKNALAEFSKSEIEDRLPENSHLRNRLEWVTTHDDDLILSAAVARRFLAATLFLFAFIITTKNNAAPSVNTFIITTLYVLLWLFVTEIGLAYALATHAASSIVKNALPLLPILHAITTPVTTPLRFLDEILRRLIGAEPRDDLEEDIRQVVEESEREGNIGETESEMLEAIVDFRNATADEVMTPRIDIKSIEVTDNLNAIRDFITNDGHSRFPVFKDTVDNIVGILYVKDLLPYLGREPNNFRITDLLREVPFIPESKRISELLVEFQQNKIQLAIVLDEYGGTAGLVTIEDIVEEIVGEIRDEHENDEIDEPTIITTEEGAAVVDARVHIDDLNDEFGTDLPEEADYDTVGGWIFATLGRIPQIGEHFTIDNLDIEILKARKTHIEKIKLQPKTKNQTTIPANQ